MPIYEYVCRQCHHQFEALVYGKEKAECPKCHATKLEPQLSVFAVSAKSSSASTPAGGRAHPVAIPAVRAPAPSAIWTNTLIPWPLSGSTLNFGHLLGVTAVTCLASPAHSKIATITRHDVLALA